MPLNKIMPTFNDRFKSFDAQEKIVLLLDLFFWCTHFWCMSKFLPHVFNSSPATGGDTGSHLWPVVVLREYGIPNFNLRVWSPANFAGEPLLVHYFPLPFIFMALASYIMPIGLAFNLGTFLPIFMLPPAIRWSCRKLAMAFDGTSYQAKLYGAIAGTLSMGVLYNEGNVMWGGNVFSDLAGQFAHQYSFVLFFLFLGLLPEVLASGRRLAMAAICFSAIVTSHAYVALFLPAVFLGAVLSFHVGSWQSRLSRITKVGLVGSALSVWFWWPLIDNSKWTSPYGLTWIFTNWFAEVLPKNMLITFVVFFLGVVSCCFSPRFARCGARGCLFWCAQIAVALLGFVCFDSIGLVNVRALPQMQYVLMMCSGWFFVQWFTLESRWIRGLAIAAALSLSCAQLYLVAGQIEKAGNWANWNYSGWLTKTGAASLRALSREIAGSFNDGRVAFEHGGISGVAGSSRVFEMLPYFSGRSTTDGLYMQSTILAPTMFLEQTSISATPSCPFTNVGCTATDLKRGILLAPLLGVDTFIFESKIMSDLADLQPELSFELAADPWRIYRLKGPAAKYAEVIRHKPERVDEDSWRHQFWMWTLLYKPEKPVVISANQLDFSSENFGLEAADHPCLPKVDIQFDKLTLTTNCVGKFHVLKFAFHDSWRSDGHEKIWLVSPGYIGITPESEKVILSFGQKISWKVASLVSLFSFGILLSNGFLRYYSRRLR